MSETKPKQVDFSNAKEPPKSIDSEVDTSAENPNLDPKFNPSQEQEEPEKQPDGIPPGERMIQQTWMRGGR
ncbi:hypothetical protein [Oscillatoria acuminata]|uniref:Uncharacterized protein n=1 Tax=Oscillatoria acuminata PCC 6304 TaxID=56110 RepID=K9TN67_9CYAN|nr:hypothetical protein [Oscillatoria acuminata]AFY83833.1 hypothetical protein Oscil6304_4307 [Oscillatoria acuminata PCC 6304]